MALNVPYQDTVPTLSLADSVGKWTQINNQQAAGKLAQQQEQRLQQQNERENKMGELKFGIEQRDALKSVATDYKAALQRKSGELGIKPGTPEYQQLANAMYANSYGQVFTNITGKTLNRGENIDLNALDALAGMTEAEKNAQEITHETAKWNARLPYQKSLAEIEDKQVEKRAKDTYTNQVNLEGVKHNYDVAEDKQNHEWRLDEKIDDFERKANTPKPMTEYQQANFEAKQEQKKLATQGQLATFDTMLDTLDRVKNHSGLDKAVGVKSYVPSMRGTDAYNFEQSLDTLKSQAFVPMVASLKGMGALSDAEGKKLTAAVGELDIGMSKEQFTSSIDRIKKDISAAKKRLETSSVLPEKEQQSKQAESTEQTRAPEPPAREGYKNLYSPSRNAWKQVKI